MRKYSFDDNGKSYVRISKAEARKIYQVEPVLICACDLRPLGPWGQGLWANVDRDFDTMVGEYEYYNCNAETGRYAAFYREIQ